jgi:hypothetical protein
MFQLDDKFLQDLGLDRLPSEQRQAFLQHIYEELELRVGTELSDGMSDEQLEQFESIIDQKEDVITSWLAANAPDYYNDAAFQRLQQATGLDVNDPSLRNEFVATKWLEVNRPDYRDVVARVLDALKQEIMGNREAILGSL